jgi:hypothetical protein
VEGDELQARVNAAKAAKKVTVNWVIIWAKSTITKHLLLTANNSKATPPIQISVFFECILIAAYKPTLAKHLCFFQIFKLILKEIGIVSGGREVHGSSINQWGTTSKVFDGCGLDRCSISIA